jgi:hypothetical protein
MTTIRFPHCVRRAAMQSSHGQLSQYVSLYYACTQLTYNGMESPQTSSSSHRQRYPRRHEDTPSGNKRADDIIEVRSRGHSDSYDSHDDARAEARGDAVLVLTW